jgi:predicted transcriptional regulator of viral defense system
MHLKYMSRLGSDNGGLGRAERRVLAGLAALERPTVTVADIPRGATPDRQAANAILRRLARKGWLTRLKRGVYSVVPLTSTTPYPVATDPMAVAMQIFAPCYISGWTAAEHWALTEQVANSVAVCSARPQRHGAQTIGGITYRVRRIPRAAIFGTTRIWSHTVAIEMATIHRTLIDVLDAPEMGGGGRQTLDIARAYWTGPSADPDELLSLARRLRRGTIFKRLGFTAERFGHVDDRWIAECRTGVSAGLSLFDPGGSRRGPILSRWNLRVNIPLDDPA